MPFFYLIIMPPAAWSATNVDPSATGSARYAWGENIGWTNLYGDGASGVRATPDYLQGFAWNENVGWLNFGNGSPLGPGSHYTNTAPDALTTPDFGVNNDHAGQLWGFAWGENIGWVNFGPDPANSYVTIDSSTGRFAGQAWGENVGWMSFSGVSISDVAAVPATAVPLTLSHFSAE